ncbi:hypothetical protein UNSW3_1116 [Campylobacter concisus UNSW3]|uniref:Uncharacterized protein n=1 Tax=Campylobacter concisus UNSW3 TaxID=1242966 RepID=U2EIR3_9BACT|nr:hypothetical protein [Campylobacter concisus]ERJ23741.1 hypothetical protein UNSW3_1116 [Campylobacter concisus UNSW3]
MNAENKINLNELLRIELEKEKTSKTNLDKVNRPISNKINREMLVKDELLKIILEHAKEYPQFKNESSVYEVKESLSFLGKLASDKFAPFFLIATLTIKEYFKNLKIIADKKKRKQTREDYTRKKAEKAIDMLCDIQDYFFNFNDIDKENVYKKCIDTIIDALDYEIYLTRKKTITPAIANRNFDKSFYSLLEKNIKNNNLTPLELAKAITRLRVTIRNIFNNKPNIRTKSDKEA